MLIPLFVAFDLAYQFVASIAGLLLGAVSFALLNQLDGNLQNRWKARAATAKKPEILGLFLGLLSLEFAWAAGTLFGGFSLESRLLHWIAR